jgi:hypothetical protein
MAKSLPSYIVLGLTAIVSFSVLFVTNLITEPIFVNRENQADLSLLNLTNLGNYTIDTVEVVDETLIDAGIIGIKTFRRGNLPEAVIYTVNTNGFAVNLNYRIGIREGFIQQLRVDMHGETTGYGADALLLFPNAIANLAIADESTWTSALVSVSTGATLTRRGIVNSLQTIKEDYATRTI